MPLILDVERIEGKIWRDWSGEKWEGLWKLDEFGELELRKLGGIHVAFMWGIYGVVQMMSQNSGSTFFSARTRAFDILCRRSFLSWHRELKLQPKRSRSSDSV